MKRTELNQIKEGKAYLEFIGNLFEYCGTTDDNRLIFLEVTDGHDIYFTEETILKHRKLFRYCPFNQVSKSSGDA